jgi:hypothetical protein
VCVCGGGEGVLGVGVGVCVCVVGFNMLLFFTRRVCVMDFIMTGYVPSYFTWSQVAVKWKI